jgi:hypothetical protein
MIGFCRHCNHLSLTLDENKICRVCLRLTEMRRNAAHPHTHDDDNEVNYRETSVSSEQSTDSKEGFFESGASGGGGASGDFSVEDSRQDSSPSDDSNSD